MRNLVLIEKHRLECVQTECEVEIRIWGKPVEITKIVSFNKHSIMVEDGGKYLRESCIFMKVGLRLI